MKNTFKFICTLALIIIVSSCSSIKVVDSWKSETASSIKDNNILVIARTQDKQARIAFEQAMSNQMRANGIKATESFRKFPNMLPDDKLSEEKLKNFRAFLDNEGYNGIVVSVVKDMRESTQTSESGGYYAGASYGYGYGGFYPSYYGGFYGYYSHPMSYSTYGSYTPSTYTTTTTKTFIVETVVYDLEQVEEKQLVAVITSQIEDPNDMTKNAEEYTIKVSESLNDK